MGEKEILENAYRNMRSPTLFRFTVYLENLCLSTLIPSNFEYAIRIIAFIPKPSSQNDNEALFLKK